MKELLSFSKMTDEEVEHVLKKHKISLTAAEARKIEEILGRAPTLTEVVIWGIQGSEHSSYRSSRQYLSKLPTSAPNVILGPGEDAGIVEIARDESTGSTCLPAGRRFGIVVSHESHNHPSQIVPFEGAATGVGGNMRDVACMGSRVIATLDPLRFGNPHNNANKLIAQEVVAGIAGYGNPVGIPNLGGDVYFDDSFNDNCLVNVVCFGVLEEKEIIHSRAPAGSVGYQIILVGKPTDDTGMGGASFASEELNEEDKEAKRSAVQEANPFLKRHLLAATYDVFRILKEKNLLNKVGFKDLGAGGIMCASVELVDAAGLGATIELSRVPVAREGLHPSVIACSETQERFCWVASPDVTPLILQLYNETWALPTIAKNACAAVIGTVTDGNYVLNYNDDVICDAPSGDITKGLRYDREIRQPKRHFAEPALPLPRDLNEILHKLLASENIASRVNIYETYDKNVQGNTVVEPGRADAGVVAALMDRDDASQSVRNTGVAVTCDGNPRYGLIDPYLQGMNAVVESLRNVAAVGATPAAITDCLNYGNPEKPEQMWEFVQGVAGIADACNGIHLIGHPTAPTPVISGNVSFYNESRRGSVAPSAIVSCIGVLRDFHNAITMDLKKPGGKLFLIGTRRDELGGSEYYRLFGELGKNVPRPHLAEAEREIRLLCDLAEKHYISACHDISEGGLAVTLAEMAILGSLHTPYIGIEADVTQVPEKLRIDTLLFTETGGFVIEIEPDNENDVKAFAQALHVELIPIGTVTDSARLQIIHDQIPVIDTPVAAIAEIWNNALRKKLM